MITKRYDLPVYGPNYAFPAGYVAKAGLCDYRHRFGGASWHIMDNMMDDEPPTLLLTLDLQDPNLAIIRTCELAELPLFSYTYRDVTEQIFRIKPSSKQVVLENSITSNRYIIEPQHRLPQVLPEKPVYLRSMMEHEYPKDEDTYWKASENLLGGDSVIRVLGPPLWLQDALEVNCVCGKMMEYVCSIGYEIDNEYRELLEDQPFFMGELAHYFFLCKSCMIVKNIWQST